MTGGWLAAACGAFALHVGALLLVVLLPADDACHEVGFVSVIAGVLSTVVVPHRPAEVAVEVLSNVVLFIPYGFFPRLLTRTGFMSWAVLSAAIELLQQAIPARVTGMSDVIANTRGSVAGVLALRVFLPITSRLSARGAG